MIILSEVVRRGKTNIISPSFKSPLRIPQGDLLPAVYPCTSVFLGFPICAVFSICSHSHLGLLSMLSHFHFLAVSEVLGDFLKVPKLRLYSGTIKSESLGWGSGILMHWYFFKNSLRDSNMQPRTARVLRDHTHTHTHTHGIAVVRGHTGCPLWSLLDDRQWLSLRTQPASQWGPTVATVIPDNPRPLWKDLPPLVLLCGHFLTQREAPSFQLKQLHSGGIRKAVLLR